MSTTSPFLKLLLQVLDENPDTWGDVLNVSGLKLLEDAIAGSASVVLSSAADHTLDDTAGGPSAADSARYMIISITGSPGGATNIIAPTRSKVYLVNNQCGEDIIFKTVAGTGPTIITGTAQWMFCDGTDIQAASVATAVSSSTATLAANSTLLDGNAVSVFAQKGVAQTFTKGQVVQRKSVTINTGAVQIDCSEGNAFYLLANGSFTMSAPSNATNGQQFTLAIEQGGGGPHTIGFAPSTFAFAGGTAPALSTNAGSVDYFGFEYVSLSGGNRWFGSIIKNVSDV